MTSRKSVLAVFGVLTMGLVLTVPMHGAEVALRTNYLTFSGPVALPGVTLQAGTYIFERVVETEPEHHRGAEPRSLEGLLHGVHRTDRASGGDEPRERRDPR